MLSDWNQVLAMSVYSMHNFFLFALCIRTSFSDISVFFRKETRFHFDRETSIQPMIVQSLTKCAMQCACINVFRSFTTILIPSVNWKEKYTCLLMKTTTIHGYITVRDCVYLFINFYFVKYEDFNIILSKILTKFLS